MIQWNYGGDKTRRYMEKKLEPTEWHAGQGEDEPNDNSTKYTVKVEGVPKPGEARTRAYRGLKTPIV